MAEKSDEDWINYAKKSCEAFLVKEQPHLVTFTRDANLRYLADDTSRRIKVSPKEGIVYLPIERFLEDNIEEHQMMWHLYNELAFYQDWRKNPEAYLNQLDRWTTDTNMIIHYLLKRIKKLGIDNDPAYSKKAMASYVKKEVTYFLIQMDKLIAFLKVQQACPIYREGPYDIYVSDYLLKQLHQSVNVHRLPKHRAFLYQLLVSLFEVKNIEVDMYPFNQMINGVSYTTFVSNKMIQVIIEEGSIYDYERFIKRFIFPYFEECWKQEIDELSVEKSDSSGDTSSEVESLLSAEDNETPQQIESTKEEETDILNEMIEQQEKEKQQLERLLNEKNQLASYGVSERDQDLFHYYRKEMIKEREDMKQFWKRIVGEAKKEESVKQHNRLKGKLDVQSLLTHYVSFHEAEKTGNYKQLPMFSRYELEPQAKQLPEHIDIIFLIDNSGSMNTEKIDAARKALAVTLLSLSDFDDYLSKQAEALHQRISLSSETWLFGSEHYKVKNKQTTLVKDRQKEIIESITKLNGQDGVTDDASCLESILSSITPKETAELRVGKRMCLILEITDGASSFPGVTKQVIDKLRQKQVELYAFQIGKNNDATVKTFDFIWNAERKEPRGIKIGEAVNKLPAELLRTVGHNMATIFN
ncbi:MAG: vWA domain-containing protein [Vagococcus sp.]